MLLLLMLFNMVFIYGDWSLCGESAVRCLAYVLYIIRGGAREGWSSINAHSHQHAAAGSKIWEAAAPSWRLKQREDERTLLYISLSRERFIILRFQIVITFVRSLAASFRSRAHTHIKLTPKCLWPALSLASRHLAAVEIACEMSECNPYLAELVLTWFNARPYLCKSKREDIHRSRQAHLAHNHVFMRIPRANELLSGQITSLP